MKHKLTWSLMPVALAACLACAAVPAQADTTQDLLNELRALKARVGELEKKLEAQAAKPASKEASKAADAPAPGMTPEQQQDFNRIAVKTEALEDSRDMLGFKGLKVSGYMDPTFVFNQRQHQAGFQFLNSVGDGGYTYDNSYIGTAAIDFVKETDGGSRWRLTLSPQRGTQAVSEGSASILHEASVSIPLTDLQTRFIAGHIPDWSGYEYLQPTLNKLITHNLLFDLTLPTAYRLHRRRHGDHPRQVDRQGRGGQYECQQAQRQREDAGAGLPRGLCQGRVPGLWVCGGAWEGA